MLRRFHGADAGPMNKGSGGVSAWLEFRPYARDGLMLEVLDGDRRALVPVTVQRMMVEASEFKIFDAPIFYFRFFNYHLSI